MNKRGKMQRQGYFSDYIYRMVSPANLEKLESFFGRSPIGLLSIQLTDFYARVAAQGETLGFRLLKSLEEEILVHFDRFFPCASIVAMENGKLNENLVWFKFTEEGLSRLAESALHFRLHLHHSFNARITDLVEGPMDIRIGHAWIGKDRNEGFYGTLFKAFCDAHRVAEMPSDPGRLRLHREFVNLLEKTSLKTVYQPIVDFNSGRILGWEAFVRGPTDTPFEQPSILLRFAEEAGQIFAIEKKFREHAVSHVGPLAPDQNLFLNIHLQTLHDPSFTPGVTLDLIRKAGIQPENIVLEFSEAGGNRDFNLLIENLDHYRRQGFKVALDNVGAGHSSLRFISHIEPDYIKIDTSLVRSIDVNPIKRVMVESFVTLSRNLGFGIIAEGIETPTEWSALVSMGVRFGQGFHIARPAYPKPALCIMVPPRTSFLANPFQEVKRATPIRRLIHPAATVPPGMTIREVRETLSEQSPMTSIVVLENRKPAGLLMNYNLDRKLGTRYGVSLYFDKEISRLMDPCPLVAEITETVEEVAKKAMNRESGKLYDDIVVTENGVFAGAISVQKMLDYLAEAQIQIAMGANPLTGLPGNVVIEQEISRRITENVPSSLIYIDLDNFKVFNDAYGFDHGDRMIRFTAQVLRETVRTSGSPGDFIGHIGGDDFIIIAERRNGPEIARAITERFETKIPDFYEEEDRKRGFIVGKGRDGIEKKFPFVSVSIGIVDCAFERGVSMNELSHRVAEVKKYAKSISGNAFVKDRRAPLGQAETDSDEPNPPPLSDSNR